MLAGVALFLWSEETADASMAPADGTDAYGGAIAPTLTTTSTAFVTPAAGQAYEALFESASAAYGIPEGLLSAIAQVESNYNPNITSAPNANGTTDQGIMQINSANVASSGINPYDPTQAIPYAAGMLANLYAQFGSWGEAVAGYNGGAGAVKPGQPYSAQVAGYVSKVENLTGVLS